MMKQITTLLTLLLATIAPLAISAQCTTSANTYSDLNTAGGAPIYDCLTNTADTTDPEFGTIGVYGSETYSLENVIAGQEYTFNMCSGTGAGSWIPEITILAADGSTVDAWNGGPATGSSATFASQCEITWTATQSGEYSIVINELGTFSGDAPNQSDCNTTLSTDNGNPTVLTGPNSASLCPANDLVISEVITNAHLQGTPLNTNTSLAILDFSERTSFDMTIRIANVGTDPADSATLQYLVVDDLTAPTEGIVQFDTIDFGGGQLASGATYLHFFNSQGIDTLFPGLASNQPIDVYAQVDSSQYNQVINDNDATFSFLISPQDSFTVPYQTSFELTAGTAFTFEHNDWAWKWFDTNDDGARIVPVRFSNVTPFDGEMTTFASLQGTNTPTIASGGDVLQSPELALDAGVDYNVSGYVKSGFGFPISLDIIVRDGSGTAVATGNFSAAPADSFYVKQEFPFTVPANADDYTVEFVKNSDGFGELDLVEIEEITDPPSAGFALTGTDETGPFVEYCDGEVTVTNLTTGVGVSSTVVWGDGSSDPIADGQTITHTYTSTGNFTITLTATNPVGTDDATQDVEVRDAPLPQADIELDGTSCLTVTINDLSVDTCGDATVTLDWGDGTVETSFSGSHTYAAAGNYDISLTLTNATGSTSDNITNVDVAPSAPTADVNVVTATGTTVEIEDLSTDLCGGETYTIDWGDGSTPATSFTSSHNYPGPGSYTITMTVTNDEGFSQDTATVVISSINEIALNGSLEMFPNPVTGSALTVGFELVNADDVRMSIVGMDGKVLAERSVENATQVTETFDVSALNGGMYILKLETAEGVTTRSFAVNR
mgnify:FL=1